MELSKLIAKMSAEKVSRRHFLKFGVSVAGLGIASDVLAQVPTQMQTLRIGAVLPMLTGDQPLGAFTADVVGNVANLGTTMAIEELTDNVERSGQHLKILVTSAPDLASSVRAAERLASVEEVSAIIGGFDDATAAELARLAAEREFVFMNIGAQGDALRGASCNPYMFHIEASSSMYVDALVSYYVASGARNWFFVRTDEPEEVDRFNRVNKALARFGAKDVVVDSITVPPNQPNFTDAINAARTAEPDIVIMLLDPQSQLVMLGQYETSGFDAEIIGYPDMGSQMRQFYATSLYDSPKAGSGRHLALWEATLDRGNAANLNARFVNRFGQGMDPPAWSAYVALKLLTEAATETGSHAAADWIHYLEDPSRMLDVYKGMGTSFRTWDHQLRQPLYLVHTNAAYSDKKSYRDVVTVEAEIPNAEAGSQEAAAELLDTLGVSQQATSCTFGRAIEP